MNVVDVLAKIVLEHQQHKPWQNSALAVKHEFGKLCPTCINRVYALCVFQCMFKSTILKKLPGSARKPIACAVYL